MVFWLQPKKKSCVYRPELIYNWTWPGMMWFIFRPYHGSILLPYRMREILSFKTVAQKYLWASSPRQMENILCPFQYTCTTALLMVYMWDNLYNI